MQEHFPGDITGRPFSRMGGSGGRAEQIRRHSLSQRLGEAANQFHQGEDQPRVDTQPATPLPQPTGRRFNTLRNFAENIGSRIARGYEAVTGGARSGIERAARLGPTLSRRGLSRDGVCESVKNAFCSINNHKTEIVAGALAATLTKAAVRTALLSSPAGIATTALIGGAGGFVAGGVKELIRQKEAARIIEAAPDMRWRRLRNEYRRIRASQGRMILKESLKGAAFGAVGAVATAGVLDLVFENEWVQEQMTNIKDKLPSLPSDFKFPWQGGSEPSPTGTPGPEATPTPTPGSEGTGTPQPSPSPAPGAAPGPEGTPVTPPDQDTPRTPVPVESKPSSVTIMHGSNPWAESKDYLRDVFGREPTNAEVLAVTKEVARQSDISVPSWGIQGSIDHRWLPDDYPLVFNDSVKELIKSLAEDSEFYEYSEAYK